MNNKKKIILSVLVALLSLVLVIGVTYAFFSYTITGERNKIITGQIYLNYTGENGIDLQDKFPETYERAMERDDNIFTFQINGKNTSNYDLYYKIKLDYGDPIGTKTRIDDEDVKIYLSRNGEPVIDGVSFEDFNDRTVLVEKIDAGTTEDQTINYTLRMWFSDDITISDTDVNADYTTSEWQNSFANVRVNVVGQAGDASFVELLSTEIEEQYADALTEADTYGNRYISGTGDETEAVAQFNSNKQIVDDQKATINKLNAYKSQGAKAKRLANEPQVISNNYVKFSGLMWRVVGINSDGTIRLITESPMTHKPWDSGSNVDYSTSEIRSWLNTEFLSTLNEDLIATSTFNYTQMSSSYEIGETKTLQDQVGLLSIFDYIGVTNADLASGEVGLMNNNYLINGMNWWTMTGASEGANVWGIYDVGSANGLIGADANGVRPIVNLKSDTKVVEGDGSKENPYVILGEESRGGDKYNKYLEARLSNLAEADINGNRYVTGLVENNYVWYSGKLWRVVALNSDGTVKLVTQNSITALAWDVNNSNNYSTSQVRHWLNNEFIKTLHNNGQLVDESKWDYGYGIATDKVGLLTFNDYFATGGFYSTNITPTYLNIGYLWWVMTPYTVDSNNTDVFYIYENYAYNINAGYAVGIRPSINLKSGIRIAGGDGSVSNPYRIEGDKEVGVNSELLNNRISGEYIKFNNTLYRIVGTETINNQKLTKITMADYSVNNNTIDTSESFGNPLFNDTVGIGLYLKNWYEGSGVDGTSRKMIATKEDGVLWYQGTGASIFDYTQTKAGEAVSATIGLPTYGEMFSSQFGVSNYDSLVTFLLSRGSTGSLILVIGANCNVNRMNSSRAFGVRPSMYLKSTIKLGDVDGDGSVGNGTIKYPYELVME